MRAPIVSAVLLGLVHGAALAGSSCDMPIPLIGTRPAVQIESDGLATSWRNGILALWPAAAHSKLNLEYAVDLEFTDASTCSVQLGKGSEEGVAIRTGTRVLSAVEAAVCDDDEGFCVPVRIEFRR